ncbi:MAG: hypothetical protein WCY41_02470 [Candidatus Micrarchaeia archaeon]
MVVAALNRMKLNQNEMNSTEGAPLQAAHFFAAAKKGSLFATGKKWTGYHHHSVEMLPVGPRRKRRGIAQLAMKLKHDEAQVEKCSTRLS